MKRIITLCALVAVGVALASGPALLTGDSIHAQRAKNAADDDGPKRIAPELTEKSYKKLRDQILPTEEEVEWKKLGWRATFWDGVIDAQEAKKPVLLFAMNGHPIGCT